ncbi:MAG: glycosyltransferase family 2 protein, partial [Thermosynechococcaceae cyanobacterium]
DQDNLNQILVIIPVLNEESTIQSVIESLQAHGLQYIRVVDNGSTDGSVAIATQAHAEVVQEPKPGYGQACWRGLQDIPDHIDWIFFCDGDGSDDLSELPQFFAQRESFDFMVGDRRATPTGRAAMTFTQGFGNQLATRLIALGWQHQYHDLGPLRLIRRSALEQIQMQDRGFGWTVEMQVRAIECGLKICELPVGYRRRLGGRSKISGTLSGSIQAGVVILTTLGQLYRRRWQTPQASDATDENTAPPKFWLWLSTLLLIAGCALTAPYGDFHSVDSFTRFGLGIVVLSLGFMVSWRVQHLSAVWFWGVSIAARLLLLPMKSGDDIWRYLWEGHIQNLGFSPFHYAPNAAALEGFRTAWWAQMNHLEVSAIYPPLAQWGFRGLAALSTSVLLFKCGFVLADLLICALLSRRFGYAQTLLYAWNPIILYSFAGGGHYDSWFLLPLVAAWLCFDAPEVQGELQTLRSLIWSSLCLGLSVAIKWISLPILSFLVWRTLQQRLKWVPIVVLCNCLPIVVAALPFCADGTCPLVPTGSTFVSHGRSAELIPYLLEKIDVLRWNNWTFLIPLGGGGLWLLLKSRRFG